MRSPSVKTPHRHSRTVLHIVHIQRSQQTVPQNPQHRLQKLPRQRNPHTFGTATSGIFLNFQISHLFHYIFYLLNVNPVRECVNVNRIKFGLARAILPSPIGRESAEVKLRPARHLRDLLVSEKDGLKAGEGGGGGGGGVDAGEVEGGEEGDEGEDDEAEIGVGGEEGVVEPVAEGVGAGAGRGGGEKGGDGGVSGGEGEEGPGGPVGVGEGGERGVGGWGEKGGEEVDAVAGFGNGLPPGLHRVVVAVAVVVAVVVVVIAVSVVVVVVATRVWIGGGGGGGGGRGTAGDVEVHLWGGGRIGVSVPDLGERKVDQ
ncbi:hypothetical protein RJ640_009054, partial [Escallonia rubra]